MSAGRKPCEACEGTGSRALFDDATPYLQSIAARDFPCRACSGLGYIEDES